MKLTRLCKSADSRRNDTCPAIYTADDPTVLVSQGKRLDAATRAELRDLATDEDGVTLPTETVLRAAGLFLADYGRPEMLAEVEDFLAGWNGGRA